MHAIYFNTLYLKDPEINHFVVGVFLFVDDKRKVLTLRPTQQNLMKVNHT